MLGTLRAKSKHTQKPNHQSVSEMEASFVEAHGILEQIGALFVQLEKLTGHPDEIVYEDNIKKKIDSLNTTFDRLEVYVNKEAPAYRQASRQRLNQMKYDAMHLNSSLQNFQKKRYRREREQSDRQELLNRRFTTNDNTTISIDHSIQQHNSLQNAHRGIDDMLSTGYHALTSLQDQKNVIKRTKTRMLNFANTLGLSNTVLQMIERRAFQDKFVLFGGMLLTIVIIFFIYLYFT